VATECVNHEMSEQFSFPYMTSRKNTDYAYGEENAAANVGTLDGGSNSRIEKYT
jgi:hypothetical protein